jgi:hypothetical protein
LRQTLAAVERFLMDPHALFAQLEAFALKDQRRRRLVQREHFAHKDRSNRTFALLDFSAALKLRRRPFALKVPTALLDRPWLQPAVPELLLKTLVRAVLSNVAHRRR